MNGKQTKISGLLRSNDVNQCSKLEKGIHSQYFHLKLFDQNLAAFLNYFNHMCRKCTSNKFKCPSVDGSQITQYSMFSFKNTLQCPEF